MKTIQNKISKIVSKYIKENPVEYKGICDYLIDARLVQKDEFASTGSDGYLGQLATVIPETLDTLLQFGLDEDEWAYYKSKTGTEWFARKFKEFSPAVKI